MPEPRLTARFWVDAYLARLRLHDIPAFVVHHGDDTAGAILIKLATLDGQAKAFAREWNILDNTRAWKLHSTGSEQDVDESIRRQRSFDPDLWVIEVEDRQGRHLLEEDGLA